MKKIVVIGPESTGKSTLCKELAAHYSTAWCPEYAREYLLQNGTDYTYEDMSRIAQGQLAIEDYLLEDANGEYYFIDTDMYVMKVWCEVVFQHCPTWILKTIALRRPDLYLLCNTDLPWVKDKLREYPDLKMRQQHFAAYKDIVVNSGVPWAVVRGAEQQRLRGAIEAVDEILKNVFR